MTQKEKNLSDQTAVIRHGVRGTVTLQMQHVSTMSGECEHQPPLGTGQSPALLVPIATAGNWTDEGLYCHDPKQMKRDFIQYLVFPCPGLKVRSLGTGMTKWCYVTPE